jgi:hypothetical protein
MGGACSTHWRDETGKIILEWILGKWGGRVWTRFIWIRIRISVTPFEHGNEPSGSINSGEFLD